MSEERLKILIDAVFTGKPQLDAAGNSLNQLDISAKKATTGIESFKEKATKKLTEIGIALGTIAIAAKAGFDALKAGAELDLVQQQFDNLTTSINTTADAMLEKLRVATHGMVSDAELVARAGQIISLGLGKTEDDVVRLSTTVSALGLDMQQVIMTFANNSIMRLDALGLSVEDVQRNVVKLQSEGFTGDAFDEAVLIALEQKLSLLGDTSLTSAGQIRMLETEVTNLRDSFELWLAQGLTPILSLLSGSFSNQVRSMTESFIEQDHSIIALVEAYKGLDSAGIFKTEAIKESQALIIQEIALTAQTREEFSAAMQSIKFMTEASVDFYWKRALAMQADRDAVQEAIDFDRNYRESVSQTTNMVGDSGIAMKIYSTVMEGVADAYFTITTAAHEAASSQAAIDAAISASQETYQKLHEEIVATETAMRGYYDTALNSSTAVFTVDEATKIMSASMSNANQILYDTIAASGASSAELALLGVSLGIVSEEAADAALKAALFQQGLDNLAIAAMADGELTRQEIFSIKEKTDELLLSISALPPLVDLDFQSNANQAAQEAQALANAVAGIPRSVAIDVSFNTPTVPTYPGSPPAVPFAHGGWVTGGEPGRDSVPSLLMPGELVVPPSETNDINSVVQFAYKMGIGRDNNINNNHPIVSNTSNPTININIYGQIESTPQAIANAISAKLSPRG